MALNTELLLTLKSLDRCGNKTALAIADVFTEDVKNIEELCHKWKSLKGKKYERYHQADLLKANQVAKHIIEESKAHGIGILSYFDERYPEILRHTINENGHVDAPAILYYRGNINVLKKPGIAIIGTREPTEAGIKAGTFFAENFAKAGFCIVSGLAIGCDTTAHKGALKASGPSVAFLPGGLDWESIYPKENLPLAKEIVEKGGLLLSEYPVHQSGNRYSLVARDRLQAGLSNATVVIQTALTGGTLHATQATLLANKPLFMVKYKHEEELKSDKVAGNNHFIKQKKAFALTSDNLQQGILMVKDYWKKYASIKTPKENDFFA